MEKEYHYYKISVYHAPQELERWSKLAKKQGLALSDWIREAILEKERLKIVSREDIVKQESPEVAELIAENKRLQERIAELESIQVKEEIFDDAKILDALSKTEWKDSLQIAQEAGIYSPSIEILAKTAEDPWKKQEIVEIMFKAKSDVEFSLYPLEHQGIVVSKKTREGAKLWRLK